MKCIVTGGAGFIGSHLTDKLISRGHRVLVLDNLSTGRLANLVHLDRRRYKFIRSDVSGNLKKLTEIFQGTQWVFHLAALADIVPSIVYPEKYYRSNVEGTVNVLEAARISGVKRFIYTASSSCYGLARQIPTPETTAIDPQYPYALTKYMGEVNALTYCKLFTLPVVSLRLFNVYGPRSRTTGTYGAVFGVFLAQKLKGKPFTVVGDGCQKRDFVFVSDVAEAFIKAAESKVRGEAFNVGSGQPQSVNKLVQLLGGRVTYLPKRPGEPDCTHADISKIRKTLGWMPKVSFEEGVMAMLKNINYWKDAPVWTPQKISKATKKWFEYLGKPAFPDINKGATYIKKIRRTDEKRMKRLGI